MIFLTSHLHQDELNLGNIGNLITPFPLKQNSQKFEMYRFLRSLHLLFLLPKQCLKHISHLCTKYLNYISFLVSLEVINSLTYSISQVFAKILHSCIISYCLNTISTLSQYFLSSPNTFSILSKKLFQQFLNIFCILF